MQSLTTLLATDKPMFLLFAVATVVLAYALFTLLGFGSALLASAPLAGVMPVASVIPLLAVLDCVGSTSRGWRNRQDIDAPALRRLLPAMLFGQLAGVLALALLPAATMAVLLGIFVAVYGIWGMINRKHTQAFVGLGQTGVFHGLLGGILGGAFGSGGFLYASYLERRLDSRVAFRATQAVLIALSTAWRLVLCIFAGLIDQKLLLTSAILLPAAFAGSLLGKHIDLRMSRGQLVVLLHLLLVCSGLGLIAKYV